MKVLYLIPICLTLLSCQDESPPILDMPIPEAISSQPIHVDYKEIISTQKKQALTHIDCLLLVSIYAKYDVDAGLIRTWLYRSMDLDDQATIQMVNQMLKMKQALSKPKYAEVVRSMFYR